MEFRLTILGSASAMPVEEKAQSAHVLSVHGRSFLIDCGEGAQRSMVRFRIPFSRLDAIFISHIHGDHVFGLFPLLSTLGMGARVAPLQIFGPPSLGPLIRYFQSVWGVGLSYDILFTPIPCRSVLNPDSGPELVYSNAKVEVYAFPLDHGIDTLGYLFREKIPPFNVRKECISKYDLNLTEIGSLKRGEDVVRDNQVILASEAAYRPYNPRSFAYVCDTAVFDREVDWVRGVDLLYHEATYLVDKEDQALSRHHSTTVQAATVARDAGVGKLLVGHYSSRCRDYALYQEECRSIFPESYAVDDGDVFEVPFVKLS